MGRSYLIVPGALLVKGVTIGCMFAYRSAGKYDIAFIIFTVLTEFSFLLAMLLGQSNIASYSDNR